MRDEVQAGTGSELRRIFVNGVLYKNPVLFSALGLFPAVAAATTLQNGVALCVMMAILLLPICFLFSLFGSLIPAWLKPVVILLLCAGLYIPISLVMKSLLPQGIASLGIYAPLMVANALVFSRAEGFASKHILIAAMSDALGCTVGFGLVTCVIAAIREILAYNTLWGHPVGGGFKISGAALPFSGFILAGFLAAIVQYGTNHHAEKKAKRKGAEE